MEETKLYSITFNWLLYDFIFKGLLAFVPENTLRISFGSLGITLKIIGKSNFVI